MGTWLFLSTLGLLLLPVQAGAQGTAKLPDLREVVPYHLDLYNGQKKDEKSGGNLGNTVQVLRFSSGIANTGDGPLELDPQFSGSLIVDANQNIYDEVTNAGNLVAVNSLSSAFFYHAQHNHWHLTSVALFEVRAALDDGSGGVWAGGVASSSLKESFCLIDYVAMEEYKELGIKRAYWDCFGQQGISVGWIDAYHHSTEGQSVDLTNVPDGIYYFIATANPDGIFVEKTLENNTSWVSFRLFDANKGNGERKIEIIADSGCDPSEPSLCGYTTNR